MTETLREKEELSRVDSENLRKSREEITSLRKRVDQHSELMAEKDRTAQVRDVQLLRNDQVDLMYSCRFCTMRSTLYN